MTELKWWQKAIFYQIYPRSFADGNNDGIGDFKGMREKLDYLSTLGIDAIWLSPHFPSPFWDCGYDISDYLNVAAEYGTLDDFRAFLAEAHQRNIKVILDLVLNHTSDQHPWFLESKSSRENSKADWYVWVDSPPNNWQSCFDGEAWTYVEERGQYYYHYFMRQQPDLNWHNAEVKKAMWDAVRFWLDVGVDGFRLDAIGTIFEDPDLTPHPVPMDLASLRRATELAQTDEEKQKVEKFWHDMFQFQLDQPGVHRLMKELRAVIDEYPGDRVLVGEDHDVSYLGNGEDELHLVFNFPLMRTERLTPEHIRRNQRERLLELSKISPDAWPCNTLGNHDTSRVYTHFGDRKHDVEMARLSLATILTLKGTPFLYNGEEIGMTDSLNLEPESLRDTMATWYYERLIDELKVDPEEAAQRAAVVSRDKNRTPMQWSNSPNGGFCSYRVKPWLPVNPNFGEGVNVRDQRDDPLSLLNFYKRLIHVHKTTPALIEGNYRPLDEDAEDHLAFLRETDGQSVLVILNFTSERLRLKYPHLGFTKTRVVYSSADRGKTEESLSDLHFAAYEIYLAELV